MADLGYMLLGNPDLSEQMMRALDLKGDLPQHLVPAIAPTAQATDFTDPEFQYLRRMNRWQGAIRQPALAANFNYAVLGRNAVPPNNRASIAIVERIIIVNNAAGPNPYWIYLNQNAAGPVGVGSNSGIPMDDRNANNGTLATAGQFTLGTVQSVTDFHPTGLVAGAMPLELPANNSIQLEGPWILTGNADNAFTAPAQLVVQNGNVNQNLSVTFIWRERNLFSSER